jgi:hypothetical protein
MKQAAAMERKMHGPGAWRRLKMDLSRRMLICSAATFSVRPAAAATKQGVHRFRTADLDIEMTIKFHDGYTSGSGFWFREEVSSRRFCLSAKGEAEGNCLSNFRGSLAIAKYTVRTRDRHDASPIMREHVRTIDHDARLDGRAPFERSIKLSIKLDRGVGSDVQAFGYEAPPGDEPRPETHGPWYLFRQDLFLEPQRTPFLMVYWKHAMSSIRVLDLIPGDQTWAIKK